MAVYIDDFRYPHNGFIACRIWADTREELHAIRRRLGMDKKLAKMNVEPYPFLPINVKKASSVIAEHKVISTGRMGFEDFLRSRGHPKSKIYRKYSRSVL